MRFMIHFKHGDNTEDSFVVEADTVEECIEQKTSFFEERGLSEDSAWSEEL